MLHVILLIMNLSNFSQVCLYSGQRETITAAPLFYSVLIRVVSSEGFCVRELPLLLQNRWSHPHCMPKQLCTRVSTAPTLCRSVCCQTQLWTRKHANASTAWMSKDTDDCKTVHENGAWACSLQTQL